MQTEASPCCGQVRFSNEHGSNQEGLYWRYEMAVRALESRLAGVTGGNGAIYATRREAEGQRIGEVGESNQADVNSVIEARRQQLQREGGPILLKRRDKSKPFFLMCHHKAPHRPWQPDARHANMYEGADVPEPGKGVTVPDGNFYGPAGGRLAYDLCGA